MLLLVSASPNKKLVTHLSNVSIRDHHHRPVLRENKSRRTPSAERPPMSRMKGSPPPAAFESYKHAVCISLAAGTFASAPDRPTRSPGSNGRQQTLRKLKFRRSERSTVETSSVCPSGDAPPMMIMVSPYSTAACELRGGASLQARQVHSMVPDRGGKPGAVRRCLRETARNYSQGRLESPLIRHGFRTRAHQLYVCSRTVCGNQCPGQKGFPLTSVELKQVVEGDTVLSVHATVH